MSVLSDWCNENNMIVNLDKTALQSFSLMHQALRPEIKYRNVSLVTTDEFKYLGITFDNKLNWRAHVDSMVKRCSSRMTILKRLAGSLWGCARSTINNTYKAFILPLLTYCCEPLISASSQALDKLDVLQNQAMRLITGAVKSTPIDSMLLLTKNRSIKTIIEEKSIFLYEKLIRLGDPFWANYQIHTRNLKTQCGFIQKVFDILQDDQLHEDPQRIISP
ncbi:hypothetical protein JTE90_029292 [Oedothorax gibbosus]|uniref:Reverse transcriptase n=1 Tax=Oedothorax gibbosus TaxID=931172 RepID=A0AAV6U3D4_9ARAC|nr:hypothetical protein JTE90_029292 [Oedothorax gibbosus]